MFIVLQWLYVHIEHNETSHNDTFDLHSDLNFTCSSCGAVYDFVQTLLIRLNVTTPCCLGKTNSSSCDDTNDDTDEPGTRSRTDPAKGKHQIVTIVVAV